MIEAPVWNPTWPEAGVLTQATISTGAAENGSRQRL
jgi:hypothetical protein